MIRIYIKESNNLIKYVSIKGHANYDIFGKDIVCSSVSSIVITTINAILRIDKKACEYSNKSGFLEIKNIKENKITNLLLENMYDLLLDLQKQYKKNILVEREVN